MMRRRKRSDRTIACDISAGVREAVKERDWNRCIWCGKYIKSPDLCHYISRGAGGLGIPQNLVCGCRDCHREADQGVNTKEYKRKMKEYLMKFYPDWSEDKLRYKTDFQKFLEDRK